MRQTIFLIAFFIISILDNALAQDSIVQKRLPALVLDFPVLDLPYQKYAARTVSGRSSGAGFGDFLRAYANPSMRQALDISGDLYMAGHLGISKLFRLKKEDPGKKRLLKALGISASIAVFDYLSFYTPSGTGWLHEEYHRAVMTRRYVSSYDDMNRFPLGASTVSVSHEKDEDLARMKAESNPDFVRLQEAGIEGEYMLIDKLQRYNFFYRQNIRNEVLYWMNTLNALLYVKFCSTPESVTQTNQINAQEGTDIKIRDFTGFDFCGWAYDLEHPGEPYANRGVHPSGAGINRYRTAADLSPSMLKYLKREGNLQLLNLISPMMLGFESILLRKDGNGNEWRGNFALRHLLTSFGHDVAVNVYYQTPEQNFFFVLHNYANSNYWFPGVEAGIVGYPVNVKGKSISLDSRIILWTQPHSQEFKTKQVQPGALLSVRAYYPLGRVLLAFVEIEGKTAGWVAGNVFLNSNISNRWGLRMNFW